MELMEELERGMLRFPRIPCSFSHQIAKGGWWHLEAQREPKGAKTAESGACAGCAVLTRCSEPHQLVCSEKAYSLQQREGKHKRRSCVFSVFLLGS